MANEEQATEVSKDADPQGGIADYLQAPRRKRKSYVVTAYSASMPLEVTESIESYISRNYKEISRVQTRNIAELKRNLLRKVVLFIFDDEFLPINDAMQLIHSYKVKKHENGMPVLFLTRNPPELIKAYNGVLKQFHESDDYVEYHKTSTTVLLEKIKNGLSFKNRRRSRRYKIEIPVNFLYLKTDQNLNGKMIDLSMHGCMIETQSDMIFRMYDQMIIKIPMPEHLSTTEGDFIKLSGRVRRVEVGGHVVGLSFEHMSESRLLLLAKLLSDTVNIQTTRIAKKQKLLRDVKESERL